MGPAGVTVLSNEEVSLPGGPRLALRRAEGARRPFLLVHGLASNALLWEGVAARLADAGHEVVAVDLRGHGRSEQVADGYTTEQCAADLAAVCQQLDLVGARAPVAAGQSWGGNVVVELAARHRSVAALALVDGGWIMLAERFPTLDDCWAALAPPEFDHLTLDELAAQIHRRHPGWPVEGLAGTLANFVERPDGTVAARLTREHHRQIVHSLYVGDPRSLYPHIQVPVLLLPAMSADADEFRRTPVQTALDLLPDATVEWYAGADHDLHAEQPDRLTLDLLGLAERVDQRSGDRP